MEDETADPAVPEVDTEGVALPVLARPGEGDALAMPDPASDDEDTDGAGSPAVLGRVLVSGSAGLTELVDAEALGAVDDGAIDNDALGDDPVATGTGTFKTICGAGAGTEGISTGGGKGGAVGAAVG